ncbi:tetratricopeptide repeat protein [Marinomonas sp. 2405UD68-3]|uniref:tetratricopeptide repeat protein n=1 Tax=Marinomonas sp. 2405UD68-3 TaxID=3391835 RepID=UPI0039C9CC89
MSFTMLLNQIINMLSSIKRYSKKTAPLWQSASSAVFCLLVLSGCSTLSNTNDSGDHQHTAYPHSLSIEITGQKTPIQQALAAEFALRRGEKEEAFTRYYDLANSTRNVSLTEKATRIALSLNNPQFAAKATDLWLSIDPLSHAVYPIRFRVFILDKQVDKLSETLLNAYNNSVPLNFITPIINAFASSPNYLAIVDTALNQLPNHLTTQFEIRSALAHTAYLQGHFQRAKKIAQSLVNDSNKSKTLLESNVYFILALIQKQEEQTEDAITTLQQGLALYPNEYSLISSLIDFELTNQNFDIAKQHYNEAELPPLYQSQLSIHYISLLIQNGKIESALNVLKEIDYLSSGFADQFYFLEASALASQDMKQDAIETLSKINGQLYNTATEQMVVWLYDLKHEQDINDIVVYRFKKRQNVEQILNIMQHHEDNLKPQLSLELANSILQQKPDANPIRYKKALLVDSLGNWQTTETELRYLLNKDPENANYLNALGYTLLVRSNRYEEAIKLISIAYEKDPKNPAIIDSLGWGYVLQGDAKKAEPLLNEAWQILPEAEIAAHYGEALWIQKKYDEAIIIWQKALDSTPNHPVLNETLNRLNPSMLK